VPSIDAGFEALNQGRYAAARDELRAAVAEKGDSVRAWKGSVQATRQRNDLQGTLWALDGVISTTTGSSEAVVALLARAAILDGPLGQQREAIKTFERVLQLDDTTPFAWLALAELSLRAGRWQNCVAHADHGLQFATLDDRQRGFLLLCRAMGQHRSTLSVGPVSSFFNALGTSDGTETSAQAFQAWPQLQQLTGDNPLDEYTDTASFIQSNLPRAEAPLWWGQ
jgi:tetratricopeptide (TPR) repeat protein